MSTKQAVVPFKKADNELQIAYGEVYLPMVPDSDGDFMTAEEIQKTAHAFIANLHSQNIDIEHDGTIIKAEVVESFIARKGDDTFMEGAWVVGVHVEDSDAWASVQNGDLSGFSMMGTAVKTETELVMEIPEFVKGETDTVGEHIHKFSVSFDSEGTYQGGVTTPAEDGHFHHIIKGTSTEKVAEHSHRFAFVEEMVNV